MSLNDVWEVAIANRLTSLSQDLRIDIASQPKQAGKFLIEGKELIDFLLSETAVQGASIGGIDCRETLLFRVFLSDRYSSNPEEKKVVNGVVEELVKLFSGFILPQASTPVAFERSRLYAPIAGAWYTELTFNFTSFRRL